MIEIGPNLLELLKCLLALATVCFIAWLFLKD